jgi:regulator of nucleoside diphosphate kinase
MAERRTASVCSAAARRRHRSGKPALPKLIVETEMSDSMVVSWLDLERLERVLDRLSPAQARARDALLGELEHAQLVEPWEMPPDVVTMNSRVRFHVAGASEEETMTLSYPNDMQDTAERLSVLTPAGMALLGVRVGGRMSWQQPDGPHEATVLGIEHQPEPAKR